MMVERIDRLASIKAGDGYAGPLILEPHPIPGYRCEETFFLCLRHLRRMLAEAAG